MLKTRGDWFKMVEYKDVCSLPLARAPESQLTAEQSSTGTHQNRYPTPKDKGKATARR